MDPKKLFRRHYFVLALIFSGVASAGTTTSAPAPLKPDTVLIKNSLTTVTKADFDTELLRLPEEYRGGVLTSATRIAKLLDTIILTKSLAAEARLKKYDTEPDVKLMIDWIIQRALAQLRNERVEQEAGVKFDAQQSQLEPRAREIYKANQAKYVTPATVRASHVLIGQTNRSKEDALKLAQEVHKLALEGKPFEELAEKYSDDPSAKKNKGDLGTFGKEKMVKQFAEAAFALKNVGDISEPVESQFGYHIIRLTAKNPETKLPYEKVRPQIMADLRAEYVKKASAEHVDEIMNDKATVINQEAVGALKINITPDPASAAKSEAAKQ